MFSPLNRAEVSCVASDAIRALAEKRTAPGRTVERRGAGRTGRAWFLALALVTAVGFAVMMGAGAQETAWVQTVLDSLAGGPTLMDAAVSTAEVVVRPGDTLWTIAREYGPANRDIREVVDWIRVRNELGSRPIRPGEVLVVPTGEPGR